jgi:hypothetical protein
LEEPVHGGRIRKPAPQGAWKVLFECVAEEGDGLAGPEGGDRTEGFGLEMDDLAGHEENLAHLDNWINMKITEI